MFPETRRAAGRHRACSRLTIVTCAEVLMSEQHVAGNRPSGARIRTARVLALALWRRPGDARRGICVVESMP
jgi:hypothetical protein